MTQQQDTKDTPVAQTVDPAPVITTVKDKKDPRRVAQGVWLAGISAKAKRDKKEAEKRRMDEMAEDARNWGEHKKAASKNSEEQETTRGWKLPKLEGAFAYFLIVLAVAVTYLVVGRKSKPDELPYVHPPRSPDKPKDRSDKRSYFGNQ